MFELILRCSKFIGILAIALIAISGAGSPWGKDGAISAAAGTSRGATKQSQIVHKVAIQVNDNDARIMNLALNNVSNIVEYYKAKGSKVSVEVVTYGPGLHMLRSDTSPVKSRIAQMSLEIPHLTFAACANTQSNMAKQEGKDVPLLAEARVVPSGVVRLMELQESGFTYIRP